MTDRNFYFIEVIIKQFQKELKKRGEKIFEKYFQIAKY
jgi:predicted HTH domain antitoxin